MQSRNFIPREYRVQVWADRAAERARREGRSALDCAFAAIDAGFASNEIHHRKLRLERAMRRGAAAVQTRCDYGWIAYLCPSSVTGSLIEINRNHQAEVRHRKLRYANGLPLPTPARERELETARLFIRWYRRFADQRAYPLPAIIDALTTPTHMAVEPYRETAA